MLDVYFVAKGIHVTCVVLTFTLFVMRGAWMIADSPLLQQPWAKQVPPLIDTLLLISAITTAYVSHQYPGILPWLTAKVTALLLYIGLGMVALTYGRTKRIRIGAWIGALLCFLYIVSVARTRQPWPFPYLYS